MAWVVDTRFGHSLFAVPAQSPFATGGGNRMISMTGAGVVYRDDIDKADVEVSCDLFFVSWSSGFDRTNGATLVARRQADGSFYYATLTVSSWSGGWRRVRIYHYDGAGDTFTFLAENTPDPSVQSEFWPLNTALEFKFRVKDNNLVASVHIKDTGDLAISTSIADTNIAVAGSPGFGSHLGTFETFGGPSLAEHYADNLTISEI